MYYKNLNAVRFVAASMVVVHHVEQLKSLAGYEGASLHVLGKLGVVVFFALSGFLITSLLLQEQQATHRISLRKFYVRRILRIWPLYFLVVGASVFVLPYVPFMQIPGTINPFEQLQLNLLLLGFLLANVQLLVVGPIAYSSQAWSIGVEEQFYLLWPLLLSFLYQKARLRQGIWVALFLFLSCKYAYRVLPSEPHLRWLSALLANYLQLDWMMWGSLFAVVASSPRTQHQLVGKRVQMAAYVVFIVLLASGIAIPGLENRTFYWDVYAALAGLLIYNLASPTSLLNLEFRWLSRLGLWSYGMYMLHVLVAWPLVKVLGPANLLLYPLVFGGTIGLAWLSYTYIEMPFLRLKSRYAVLHSPKPVTA